jgi:hypothetical protein
LGLTSPLGGLNYGQFRQFSKACTNRHLTGFMNSSQSSQSPDKKPSATPCKHPRVQIVSRDEESEFVECKECGEIFDSSEFKDMSIEETKLHDLEE